MGKQDFPTPFIKTTTLALALIAAAFLSFRVAYVFFAPTSPIEASDLTVENILAGVNKERSERNLVTLSTNNLLASAADFKARDMIARKYFAHVDPDGQYIWPKIASLGYAPYSMLGENLAIEFYSTDSLVRAWMDSPTHRANVLQGGFRDQGVGLAFGNVQNGEYGTSISNTFGTLLPKKAAPAPKPATTTKKAAPAKKATPAKKTTTKKTSEAEIETPVIASNDGGSPGVAASKYDPINPRGLASLFPTMEQYPGGEPNFEIGSSQAPETPSDGPDWLNSSQPITGTGANPYAEFRLWAIIVAVGALALLAFETKKYIKANIHIPRHRWNTIIMLLLTLLVTGLIYLL